MRLLGYLFVIGLFGSSVQRVTNPKPGLKIREFEQKVVRDSKPSKDGTVKPRVYGGSEAPEGEFKFMISQFYSQEADMNGLARCSAALISPKWVLLAAHCFRDGVEPNPKGVLLVGGKADLNPYITDRFQLKFSESVDENKLQLQERRAERVIRHELYEISTKIHDIALVIADKEFILGKLLSTIPLSRDEMKSRTPCTILGWGLSEGDESTFKLRFAENIYAKTNQEGCIYKTPQEGNFICIEKGGSGICQGDSGSPLVCDGKVWGVASHLVSESETPTCGVDFEEYYVDLHAEIEWLDKHLGVSPPTSKPEPTGPVGKDAKGGAASNVTVPILYLITFYLLRFYESIMC